MDQYDKIEKSESDEKHQLDALDLAMREIRDEIEINMLRLERDLREMPLETETRGVA